MACRMLHRRHHVNVYCFIRYRINTLIHTWTPPPRPVAAVIVFILNTVLTFVQYVRFSIRQTRKAMTKLTKQ